MVPSRPERRGSRKSRLRLEHRGEADPVSVQIAGADPAQMANAARLNADEGAQIIDINMGCPAKKVCNVAAGSALLAHAPLGALRVARIAESAGVRLIAVHGRTRACGFRGQAEFETVADVKAGVRIPVIANGDIGTPEEAAPGLALHGADGVMIARGAHGGAR